MPAGMEFQVASEAAFDAVGTGHTSVEEDIAIVDKHTEIVVGNDLVGMEMGIVPFAGLIASVSPASDVAEPALEEA